MAEDAAIQIAYNRKALSRLIVLHAVLCVALLPMTAFLGWAFFDFVMAKGWPNRILGFLGLFEIGVLIAGTPYLVSYLSTLRRSLRLGEPALVINRTGIVARASGYMVGQLAWDEIQKMHLWTDERRLISNRFFKTRIIARYRMIVIVMKDKSYLQRLPRVTAFQIKIDNRCRNGGLVFVPEYLLEITSDEVMTRLNAYYIAEVRGA